MTQRDLPPVIRTRVETEAREASLRLSVNPPGELVVVLDDCVLNNLDHRAFPAKMGDVVEIPAGWYVDTLIDMGLVVRASDLDHYGESGEEEVKTAEDLEATEADSQGEPIPSSEELGFVVPDVSIEDALVPTRRGRPKSNARK